MDLLAPILGFGFVLLLFGLLLWVPTEILQKAGYSRWWALIVLIPPVGFIAIILFAVAEWPILRELAWRRLVAGSDSERDLSLAQSYAIDLERKGEWQRAIEVYEVLAQRLPDKQEAEYVAKSVGRLRDLLDRSMIA